MHNSYLLAAIVNGVLERIFGDASAACAGVHPGADRHRVRVVADGNLVFKADVETLQILAHQHQVDVFIAPSRQKGAGATYIGVQLEFFTQSHVRGAVATADGVVSGPLRAKRVRLILSRVI